MLNFYMDHNVHAAITAGLRRRGIDCLTALEDRMDRADDVEILLRAMSSDRVLFTHDDDLLAIASAWVTEGRDFAGVVYGAQRSVTIGGAIVDLELIAHVLMPEEIRNRIEYLTL
jgi:hypothetical protein